MSKNHDIIDLAVTILHRTDKAIMVENLDEEKVWLPLSQVESDNDGLGEAEIQVPEWLASDRGLI